MKKTNRAIFYVLIISCLCSCRAQERRIPGNYRTIVPTPRVGVNDRPDGSSPQRVMSIDFKDTDVEKFFQLLGSVSGKDISVCDQISGLITYQARDVSWQKMLQDVAQLKAWSVLTSDTAIEICKK